MSVVIVRAKRSAFGRYLGGLAGVAPLELGVLVGGEVIAGIEGVERAYVGNCFAASFATASVVGRQVALKLGIDGFATTVDTACCSPLTALRLADTAIRAGEIQAALVLGVESMSRVPHLARGLRAGVRAGKVELEDPIFPIDYKGYAPVSADAERGARKHRVTRTDMDAWAVRSHELWAAATEQGGFADELVPVTVAGRKGETVVDRDEQPRPGTTMEALARLKPVFGTNSITPGNAPGLNDGAAAVLVCTREWAEERGLEILATVDACRGVAASPEGMSWVPALALQAALPACGLSPADLDALEINEAFAAVPLVSARVLANGDSALEGQLLKRCNVNGGSVAIGHPVGATGLRILTTLVHHLRRRGGGRGAAAICGGLAQGEAVVVSV